MFFLALNYREFCIMETFGLMAVTMKIIEFGRKAERFNKIYLTLNQSFTLLGIFLNLYITVHEKKDPRSHSLVIYVSYVAFCVCFAVAM